MEFGKQEKRKLLFLARRAIQSNFSEDGLKVQIKEENLKHRMGVFVTINTTDGELRGCIGFLKPEMPLWQATAQAAKMAAFQDPRFPPMTSEEVKDVLIEITVLGKLEKIKYKDVKKIKVGEEGLYVMLGPMSGLLLAQVAKEHKWGAQEFLEQTCTKANLPRNAYKDPSCKIYKFTCNYFSENNNLYK